MYPREIKRYINPHRPAKRKIVTTTLQILQNIKQGSAPTKKPDNNQLPGLVIKIINGIIQ
jgi:hypothetical protein